MNLNVNQWNRYQAAKAKRKKSNFEESKLQQSCVSWFRLQYPRLALLLFAIPNGASLSGDAVSRAKQWKRLEAEGAVSGVADLFLSVPSGDYAGLYIEMKTKKGSQSDKQKEFETEALDRGYGYAMPRSLDEFMRVIQSYLTNGTY